MARILVEDYAFDASEREVTINVDNFRLAQLASIYNETTKRQLYSALDLAQTAVDGNTITLPYGSVKPWDSDSDTLRIYYLEVIEDEPVTQQDLVDYVNSKAPHVGSTPPADTSRLWIRTS